MATMNERIDGLEKMLADLSGRMEGVERRQAVLACRCDDSEPQSDDEDADWSKLADMLGLESPYWMAGWMDSANHRAGSPLLGLSDDDKIVRAFKAMLIGLACDECNGCVWVEDGVWHWECKPLKDKWDWANSRPAAAIAMLKAHADV